MKQSAEKRTYTVAFDAGVCYSVNIYKGRRSDVERAAAEHASRHNYTVASIDEISADDVEREASKGMPVIEIETTEAEPEPVDEIESAGEPETVDEIADVTETLDLMTAVKFNRCSVELEGVKMRAYYKTTGEGVDAYIYTGEEKTVAHISKGSKLYAGAIAAAEMKRAEKTAPVNIPDALRYFVELEGEAFEGKIKGRRVNHWGIRYTDAGKIEIRFDRHPGAEIIELVKASGFYWSPSRSCWSRGLKMKGHKAAQEIAAALRRKSA